MKRHTCEITFERATSWENATASRSSSNRIGTGIESLRGHFCGIPDAVTQPFGPDSLGELPISDGYFRGLGRFVLLMGRLESSACSIAQLLAVVDPALLSTSVALRRARHQACVSMPPWARVQCRIVCEWIDDVLALLRERNKVMHWSIREAPWDDSLELGFLDPHDWDWLPTNVDHVRTLSETALRLDDRAQIIDDGLCYEIEPGVLIDPMASLDLFGSGDVGFHMGINDDWPEPQPRKLGGRSRRLRH